MKSDVSNVTLEKVKSILSGSLLVPANSIQDDSEILSIGDIDSLTFELIVLEMENSIGRPVDPAAILEARTVRDLAAMIDQ